jgi:cation diffusion facilitator family transporter
MDDLAALGRRVALVSIFLSAGLALAKITIGLMAGSTAVVSDGFESAGDVFASSLVLLGLIIAAKPPDREHPYGHGRFEILTGLWVGILLCATGALICYRSIEHLHDTALPPRAYAIWPMLISIVLKSVSWSFKRVYGRKIRSESLTADAWNDAVDIVSGVTALIALSITLLDPVRFASADQIGGCAVGLIVIFLGLHVSRDTTLQLMDTMPAPPMMKEIRETAVSVPGAMGVEKCFARKTGLTYHVDLHLEVDPAMTVAASHDIATEVKNRIKDRLDWVADVLVHVEPHGK